MFSQVLPTGMSTEKRNDRMLLSRLKPLPGRHGRTPAGVGGLKPSAGFTFLEVLVAVTIIAIAFVTLIGSQSQSVSVAGDSRFNVNAALLAQQKLTELEAGSFDDVFSSSGDFGEDHPAYHWRSEVTDLSEGDVSIPGANDMLKSIDLVVTLGEGENMSYGVRSIIMRRTEPAKP